ncbi:hypothetical protein [Duganella caerulea]|uniref:hypothetical protein n=1 Tax=Duganella caerulea TaxID=2885762 RepID=UPI00403774E1
MKKKFLFLMVLCASAYAQAFTGTINLAKNEGAVKRTLILSKWSIDKRGVPSFDYHYSQSGPKCDYERAGRAIAGFEDAGGHVELQVYSGQDSNGKEGPAFTIFYDKDDEVVFTMPTSDKSNHVWVSFEDALMKKKLPAQCRSTGKDSATIFKK